MTEKRARMIVEAIVRIARNEAVNAAPKDPDDSQCGATDWMDEESLVELLTDRE